MLRNVFVIILGKIEKGLEFVANSQNRTKMLFGSHVKNDLVDPTNHQIVGFYGTLWDRKSNYTNFAFFSIVFYATSKSTWHFLRIKCDASNKISLDGAFSSNKERERLEREGEGGRERERERKRERATELVELNIREREFQLSQIIGRDEQIKCLLCQRYCVKCLSE